MAVDAKYGKVTTRSRKIPADEPVFILRAQDVLAADTIAFYSAACRRTGVEPEHVAGVEAAHRTFLDWRDQDGNEVKLPDTRAAGTEAGE